MTSKFSHPQSLEAKLSHKKLQELFAAAHNRCSDVSVLVPSNILHGQLLNELEKRPYLRLRVQFGQLHIASDEYRALYKIIFFQLKGEFDRFRI